MWTELTCAYNSHLIPACTFGVDFGLMDEANYVDGIRGDDATKKSVDFFGSACFLVFFQPRNN